jgi:hypothetical protein
MLAHMPQSDPSPEESPDLPVLPRSETQEERAMRAMRAIDAIFTHGANPAEEALRLANEYTQGLEERIRSRFRHRARAIDDANPATGTPPTGTPPTGTPPTGGLARGAGDGTPPAP